MGNSRSSMFATAIVLLIGFPVAFTLGGVALLFAMGCMAVELFDYAFLRACRNAFSAP